ncbi:unnamed protein product [Parnassius apollo]|uniref:(apollo) hypothetical protein n=1 Tax=Parnassius apollo TaxID=110799 RepID=A0A8S3W3L7_PARAO|nr:unnamed protein product [Parnassius apollo]
MDQDLIEWGCCSLGFEDNIYKLCNTCNKAYHLKCLNNDVDNLKAIKHATDWIGPCCIRPLHATGNKDNTPVKCDPNITVRASKRQALSSPPEIEIEGPVTRTEVRNIMEEIIQKHISDLMVQMTKNGLFCLIKGTIKSSSSGTIIMFSNPKRKKKELPGEEVFEETTEEEEAGTSTMEVSEKEQRKYKY